MKMLTTPFDYVRSSLARKLVAVVILIYGLLASLLIWELTVQEAEALKQQRIQRAEGVASMLAASGASWVLSEDRAGLRELITASTSMKAHRYSMFLDPAGRILAHSRSDYVGRYAVDPNARSLRNGPQEPRLIAATEEAVDAAAPVVVDGRLVGWAWVSIDTAEVKTQIRHLVLHALGYGAASVLLGLLISVLIARGVTRRIGDLAAASERFRKGERNVRVTVRGRDEVAAAAQGLNGMFEAVSESERSLKEVQRIAGLGSWRYDPASPTLEWSAETHELFGFPPSAARPTFEQFVAGLPKEQRAAAIAVAKDPDHRVSSLTLTLKRPDGGERICWVEIRSERKADGTRILKGICQDVTEREAAAAQLHQAQKMEAVGQLTGGLAHDFNNLLAIVIGNLDIANDEIEEGSLAKEAVDEALEAVLRGSKLTKQLLAFSRRQPLATRSVDVNALIREFEPLWRRTVGADIEVQTFLADALRPTRVDPAQMESAVLNLVINARDAMPEGGTLTLETATVELGEPGETAFDDIGAGVYSVITVSDTGRGMSPDVLERACEPFFTTKGVGKGSGLGLSMIYGFAKQSGGHLKIYSEVGRGTAVRLYLPVSDAGAEATEEVTIERPLPKAADETVLVVEDDERVRRVVQRQLAELGYRVVSASNGAEALDALETQRVDLLFTDIVMPGGMSGIELGRRAASAFPDLRILYTSGFTRAGAAGLDPGASLLSKPYRKTDLARRLRQILDMPQLEPVET